MSTWKIASLVFSHGTEQIRALKGQRVRARAPLQGMPVFEPYPTGRSRQPFDVRLGAVGFVANAHPQRPELLLAFPDNPSATPADLETLTRSGSFKVVVVNQPTFRLQFDVAA